MAFVALQYMPYNGQLSNQRRWLSIFLFGLECTFRRWFTVLLLILAWLSAILKSVNFFIMSQGQMITQEQLEAQGTRYFTQTIMGVMDFQIIWLAILLTAIGAGLISNDMKNGAYQLYFARSIRRKDYIIGKSMVVLFYSFLVIWLPILVIWVHCFLFSGFHSSPNWKVVAPDITGIRFLQSLAYLTIITLFMGSLLLALSSLTKNSKFVGLIFIGILFLGKFLEQIAGFLKIGVLSFFSFLGNLHLSGRFMFNFLEEVPSVFMAVSRTSAMTAGAFLACLIFICLYIIYRRVKHIIHFGQ